VVEQDQEQVYVEQQVMQEDLVHQKEILEEHQILEVQQVVVAVELVQLVKMHLDQQTQEMVEQDLQVILQVVVLHTLEVEVVLENLDLQ
jgi:ABC-type ATPase with predicted acetyltransferase domain